MVLDLSREDIGQRLGYRNPAKAAGRVYALCDHHPFSKKSRHALQRLPAALGLSVTTVEQAVSATEKLFAAWTKEAEDQSRRTQEAKDAEWRASFRPHCVIQTEHTVPTQITICGLTGGATIRLVIPFDLSRPPVTFVQQAVGNLPFKTNLRPDGRRCVMFFGEVIGLIINYTPESALRCLLDGTPLEVLDKAYRLGDVRLSFGGRSHSPASVSQLLGFRRDEST
ncbi:hypothetical protein ASF32_13735 [Methylobacterium sp. Leaf91]|nr:hypothetical protein ASF32_13735 [Methylobacterium sp. Leaf91]